MFLWKTAQGKKQQVVPVSRKYWNKCGWSLHDFRVVYLLYPLLYTACSWKQPKTLYNTLGEQFQTCLIQFMYIQKCTPEKLQPLKCDHPQLVFYMYNFQRTCSLQFVIELFYAHVTGCFNVCIIKSRHMHNTQIFWYKFVSLGFFRKYKKQEYYICNRCYK